MSDPFNICQKLIFIFIAINLNSTSSHLSIALLLTTITICYIDRSGQVLSGLLITNHTHKLYSIFTTNTRYKSANSSQIGLKFHVIYVGQVGQNPMLINENSIFNHKYKSTKSSQVGQIGLKSHVTYVTLSKSKNLLIKKKKIEITTEKKDRVTKKGTRDNRIKY